MSTRDELAAIIDHAYTTKDWTGPRSTAEVIADAVLEAGRWTPSRPTREQVALDAVCDELSNAQALGRPINGDTIMRGIHDALGDS
jgi:hypothetical protein